MSRDPAGRASTSQVPDPALKARADMRVTPDCPSAEDSDDVSVTNSEIESTMNHRRRRATLHDPGFIKEAFNAFISADAYIRAARWAYESHRPVFKRYEGKYTFVQI